jgi:hypothetical protein
MSEHDTPNTMSRVQRQIDLISNASSSENALTALHVSSGYLLALFFEGLIDNREHAELSAEADQAWREWKPAKPASQLPEGGGFQRAVAPPPRY